MSELKPCPFCGGKGEIYQPIRGDDETFVVGCTNCNADGGYYDGNDSTTPEDAIDFWNTRAATPQPAPTEMTVNEFRYLYAGWLDNEIYSRLGDYLKDKFPNGIKIV